MTGTNVMPVTVNPSRDSQSSPASSLDHCIPLALDLTWPARSTRLTMLEANQTAAG